MNGDYTKVPLRREDRWTGARMQQGRVLLDHDWNLNLDAAGRATQSLAADAIGPAGVLAGSDAFEIAVTAGGALDLTVGAGRMWVDGLAALAPAPFTYSAQDQIAPLPDTGLAFVYLDVFCEHVQPAEDPLGLVDPALSPSDSCARTRVGYRVRAVATTAASCGAAWSALAPVAESDGRLTIERTGPVAPADPCDPPGDPLAQVPNGLFRVEVLDGGSETSARFAWSFEDGGVAVTAVAVAGDSVTLAPSPLRFAVGDRVEVSWLARRADRAAHGALYTVSAVTPAAGGDVLTLDRAVSAPTGAAGLAVRRWDGESAGVGGVREATYKGLDLGVRFTPAPGDYEAGDWWGARLRAESAEAIEHRVGAAPDGVEHAFAPLALVDLDARAVLSDCRPTFTPLTGLGGACTVSVSPGDDLQAAVARLPADGGELCFAAGTYVIDAPLEVFGRRRVVFHGAGPATVLRSARREAPVVFEECSEVEVRHLRAEGAAAGEDRPADRRLDGALTFLACRDVVVADCVLACPDAEDRSQTCVTVRGTEAGAPDRIRIERNRVEVGAWQTGVLVLDADTVTLSDNHVVLAPRRRQRVLPSRAATAEVALMLRSSLRERAGRGISRVTLPGAEEPVHIEGAEVAALARDLAATARPSAIRRGGGPEKALLRFARSLATHKGLAALSPASLELVERLTLKLRCAGQGIVVGGAGARNVRVLDNLVEDATQGIHVGVSGHGGERRTIETVLIARNVVKAAVPASYDRERHGVFVGNARSVHVLDTAATLRRLPPEGVPSPTPVEGVRIHGELGPFLAVRQTSLQGFSTGVRVVPLPPVPQARMWLVAETLAEGAGAALVAPAGVERERNVP